MRAALKAKIVTSHYLRACLLFLPDLKQCSYRSEERLREAAEELLEGG